jgi:hypothetical protein
MADVEQTRGLPDGLMLFQYAAILHRHVPAAEGDKTRAMCGMKIVKWYLKYAGHGVECY